MAADGVMTATILFTDIVGSTEMRTRLGDSEADDLRRAHDQAVAGAVDDHGGEVVKGLGDGAMAVFPGAADAVRAGVAVQQGIDSLNRGSDDGHALAVRVGLGAGDVVWEEGDCHGTPVVVAARLCDAAEGGQVLCDDLVRGLARRRATQEFVELGDRELKGLDEPVLTYEVGWAPLVTGEAPMPGPLAMVPGEFPFAGRQEERDRLAMLWKGAQADGRTVALVSGEPGQGKTRLASELARGAHTDGAWVLLGRCDERIAAPYAPWLEVLHHVVAHADESVLSGHVERQGGELTRLVPELADRVEGVEPPRDLDPETERLVLFDAVTDLLVALSQAAPLMVVVDDAHWADGASVDLLGRLITHLPPDARVLLVVTYRDTDIDRVHPLARAIADLRREPRVERIALRGMTTEELESLLAAAGGHDLDETGLAFAANLARETEGNPFFVGEILRHLVDSGTIVQEDGRWQGSVTVDQIGIPEGIRDVVGRRLTGLSEAANDTLRTAAVVGREFDVGIVATVTEQDEDAVLDHVEEALEARVLEEVADRFGRLSFSHALMRSTLLEELSTVRRVRLHARIGDALEATGEASAAELAYHFGEAAATGRADKAVEYAVRAAEGAMARVAREEAIRFYDLALEAFDGGPRDPERAEVLLGRARAANEQGDPDAGKRDALAAAEIATAADDTAMLVRAAVAYEGMYNVWAEPGDPVAIEMLTSALEQVDEQDLVTRALAHTYLANGALLDVGDRPLEEAEEAVRLARQVEDPRTRCVALTTLAWALRGRGRPDDLCAIAREAIEVGTSMGQEVMLSGGTYNLAHGLAERGDMDDAREAYALNSTLRTPLQGWNEVKFAEAEAAAEGRWDEAVELGDRAHELGGALGAVNESMWTANRLRVEMHRGRLDDAWGWLERSLETALAAGSFEALLHLAGGDTAAAREASARWEELVAGLPQLVMMWQHEPQARTALELDDEELAARLSRSLAPLAGTYLAADFQIDGAAEHPIGLVALTEGRVDDAVEALAFALSAAEGHGWHALVAGHQVDLAAALIARDASGDAERAADLLRDAAEAAALLDMAPTEQRARSLLA